MGIAVIIGAWVEATQEANCEPMNYSTKSNTDHIRSWYAATAHTLPNCPTLEESIAAASKPPHADDLHRYYDHLRRKYADMDPDAITRSKMREHTDTSIYFGGLLDRSAGQLHSRLAGKIMPINNYIIATEPLLETSRPETGSRERCRCGYPFCGQLLPTQYGHPPALWRGGKSYRRRVNGDIYYAQGFSGHGVVMAGYCGHLVAQAITGTMKDYHLFARRPQPRFPGGTLLGWRELVAGMVYYNLRDRL